MSGRHDRSLRLQPRLPARTLPDHWTSAMRLSKFMLEFVPACLLLVMAFLTSASAVSRYVLNVPIPDEYEISRMLLAIVICWGLAVAFYYNDHIFLYVLWGRLSRKAKLELTRLGNLLSLGIMGFYC